MDDIEESWAAHEGSLGQQQRRKYPPITNYSRFDMARKGHSRRILAIPNPISQFFLSKAICEHQGEFEETFKGSEISLTPANISASSSRAVPLEAISKLSEKRIQSYATAKVILQTDVLSFYHSIYTHSIPWALHGKRVAKKNRSTSDPLMFGNLIDALMRSCQDGQTIGVPVGPDTSRIISEIILCAAERQVGAENFAKLSAGYRYMDDFFLCFSSHVDAETFLAALREAMLSFDLQLNAAKTQIFDAIEYNEEAWPGDISQLKIRSGSQNQRRDLMRYFTESIRLGKLWPDESIASFSIRKSSRILVERENWDIYEPFLLRMARENSNSLDSVVKIICTYAAAGYPMSGRVQTFAEGMIEEHAPYNHHYEVAWTLWLCRSLGIRLGERATQLASRVENSACACLFLMLRSRSLLTGRGSITEWTGTVTSEDLHGEHWMLIYEAGVRKTWKIPGAEAAVTGEPHFRALKEKDVSFFDTSARNVPLELPQINRLLERALEGRRTAVLNGNILFESRIPRSRREYQTLGEDYGEDSGNWDEEFHVFGNELDDLDELF
ncbi:RNA-directed DNA polymerase [Alloyangia pacifica]|uniref:RNA-directed DNA polymerase n=1 Tax=Alloyangia pacifica TaxID=311180 RepID=UPI0015A23FAF|nr:RNA-directed DNA polymerase [Alloyangia pacifica]